MRDVCGESGCRREGDGFEDYERISQTLKVKTRLRDVDGYLERTILIRDIYFPFTIVTGITVMPVSRAFCIVS